MSGYGFQEALGWRLRQNRPSSRRAVRLTLNHRMPMLLGEGSRSRLQSDIAIAGRILGRAPPRSNGVPPLVFPTTGARARARQRMSYAESVPKSTLGVANEDHLTQSCPFYCLNGERTGRREHPAVRGVDVENQDAALQLRLIGFNPPPCAGEELDAYTPDYEIKEPSTARDEFPRPQNFLIVGSSALLAP
jgi:hypothetical protein